MQQSAERAVRTWMGSGRDSDVLDIAQGVSNGDITMVDVVKALGEYLTSEDDTVRTKGVELLSRILELCPPEKINRTSTRVLVTFMCGKLDDTETIVPALKALHTMASLPGCTSATAEEIVKALFRYVKMSALTAPNRYNVFSIIDVLMTKQRDALKKLQNDFLVGYIGIAEGEKDPRNLLTAFAIARVILVEFDISFHVEAMFNIIFCYFPISFRPPPNDPYGISADDLKLALRSCLCATPLFGPLAISVYLEKLAAGSPTSKRDTLQSMSASFPAYGSALVRQSARKLWAALKLEIFQPTDSLTETEALSTTQILIRTIYTDDVGLESSSMEGLAREVCEECVKILREPEKTQARPAIKVLSALMSTTAFVSRYTVSQAVPHLVKTFYSPGELENRAPTTVLLAELVSAAQGSARNFLNDEPEVFVLPFKDEILGVFTAGLNAASTRVPALVGLKALVTTLHLLTDDELGFIVHNVQHLFQADNDGENDASDDVIDLLTCISKVNWRHVEDQILPLLSSSLPDIPPRREAISERAKYWRTLLALSRICVQQELFENMVIRLTTKLDLLCGPTSSGDSKTTVDLEVSSAYAHAIITSLHNTISAKVCLGHTDVPKYVERLVSRLYNLFIYSAIVPNNSPVNEPRVIAAAAHVITLVVQSLNVQRQDVFAKALFSSYLDGDIGALAEGNWKIPANKAFEPLKKNATVTQRNLVTLFSAGIIPLRKEINIGNAGQFLSMIIDWGSLASDFQRQAVWCIVESIVNKRADDIPTFLDSMVETFWKQNILDTGISVDQRLGAIRTWIWVSKALTVRSYPDSVSFVNKLFEVFGDRGLGWDAAKGIGEIAGRDETLTKQNHAIIKILYAQKYINSILPRIIGGATSETAQEQSSYLVALASLIKVAPQKTYVQQMPSIMPLLIRGLGLPDDKIRADIIDTLLSMAGGETVEYSNLSEHVSTLVSTMLKNCTVADMALARVRVVAVRFLGILPTAIRYDVLHPHKAIVLRVLAKVLDDPKRLVRKEAVDARTNWFKCDR